MVIRFNFLKQFVLILLITVFFYLILDFFIGTKIIDITQKKYNLKQEKTNKPTIIDNYFKYNFKKNLKQSVQYGIYDYQICTNDIGIRISCLENKTIKDYEILFIGDSFTEGVGLPYEKTFVGIFEKEKNYKIANLAVSGYSPYIYYKKILSYEEKIDFKKVKEVIVFIDISDNQDDLRHEKINFQKTQNQNISKEKKNLISMKSYFRKIFPLTYEILFQIKNFKLPKPRYRYVQSYGASAWTYNKKVTNYDFNEGIKKNIFYMEKLYKFLKSKNINLSISIYPWPNTLIYDKSSSLHVKIWQDFCLNKCKNFINYFPIFFENKSSLSLDEAKIKIDKYFFKYDMHFNSNGHQKISKHLISLY